MGKDIKWGDLVKRHYQFFTGIEVESILDIPDDILSYYTLENRKVIESVVAFQILIGQSSSVRSLSHRSGIGRTKFRKWVETSPSKQKDIANN